MAKTETIRARVEPELKHQAEALLRELGMSVTEAITLFYRQVTMHRGLPFEVKIPNADTTEALHQAESGAGLAGVRHLEELKDRDAVSHARTGDQSLRERPQASDQARQGPGQALECRRSAPVRLRSSSPQQASPPVGAVVCLLGVSHRAGLAC